MAAAQSLAIITPSPANRCFFLPPIVSSARATLTSASIPNFTGLRIRSGAASTRHFRPARPFARRSGSVVCESPDTATELTAVTDSTWQTLVLDSDLPVLVEFWTPWCGPCRMIHPVIDELAKQYTGKLKCFKVNTDEGASIATRYGIRSIPTVLIFKNGEKKEAVIGAVPKSTLSTCIDKLF